MSFRFNPFTSKLDYYDKKVSAFLGLSDTPGSYTGEASKFVKVNATPDGLAFATISAGDLPSGIDAIKIADGSVSNAEFQYLNSVTSNIQTQIDGKQPLDSGLTSLAGLVYASDSFIKVTATDTYAIRTIAEIKTDLSLNNVENTALSGWAGTSNITTLGAIGTCVSADIGGATNYIQIAAGGILTMQGSATIDGVADGNLLDKTASETITGAYIFIGLNHSWRNNGAINFNIERATDNSYGPSFYFKKERGIVESPVVVNNGDTVGVFYFSGYSANASAFLQAASILVEIDGEPDTGADVSDMPGRLLFKTSSDGSATPAERMRIDSNGVVIIKSGELRIDKAAVAETPSATHTITVNLNGTDYKLLCVAA